MNLKRTEFRKKINNSFHCNKMSHPSKKYYLCISVHILMFISLSHFTIVSANSLL